MKGFDIQGKLKKLTLNELKKVLLRNRGITEKEVDNFLNPKFEDLTLKTAEIDLESLKKSFKRVKKAIEDKEQIIVFGDYDVDGITGVAILWETLNELGAKVMPYIPHRIDEGYGLSVKGITNLLDEFPKTSLIITVDNGIVASDAVLFAKEKNIDVIITDHHMPAKILPKAYSIIHTTKICGAGVGWFFARFMAKELGEKENPRKHLELVALATVADLMPLTSLNRLFVKFGLEELRNSKRVGLLEIYKEAVINQKNIDTYQIGHVIAPRLNAMGRMEHAMDSLRLICTTNQKRAIELAFKLGATNKERQKITFDSFSHAKEVYEKTNNNKKLIFISNETYQQGVIGLIAGRLVEEFYKPAIVLSIGEVYSKASARSVKDFNIIEFIREGSEFLIDAGGHPGAAGFTIETKNLPLLQKKLEELAEKVLGESHLIRKIRIDCQIPLVFINEKMFTAIRELEPFGMGNPEPVFLSENVIVEDIKGVGVDRKHLKISFRADGKNIHKLNAIFFNGLEKIGKIKVGDSVTIAFSLLENEWNGNKSIELKIRSMFANN